MGMGMECCRSIGNHVVFLGPELGSLYSFDKIYLDDG